MIRKLRVFSVLLFIRLTSAQDQQVCLNGNNKPGKCAPSQTCLSALQDLLMEGIPPTICSYPNCQANTGYTVCCPDISEPIKSRLDIPARRISDIKCGEYEAPPPSDDEPAFFFISVVGGVPAKSGEFPHVAALGWTKNGTILWNCGGSLISPNFILTAAHCTIDNDSNPPDTIRLGDIDLANDTDTSNDQQFGISSIIRHPQHRFSSVYHDIALIKMNGNAFTTKTVRPGCISENDFGDRFTLTAVGYGQTEFAGRKSFDLQKVSLQRYTNEECSENVEPSRKFQNGLSYQQFCAADPYSVMDTCQGDSGGPLSIINGTSHYILGITSFGKGCASDSPSVYTRISQYISWIESVVW